MKLVFVCLGNICRSPMAEAVLKSMAPEDWEIASRATSSWEHGNPVHEGTKGILKKYGVRLDKNKRSQQIKSDDFLYYDRIIAMDESNLRDLRAMAPEGTENKISKLLVEDVPDPWYTGDFEETYSLINWACQKLMLENITQ